MNVIEMSSGGINHRDIRGIIEFLETTYVCGESESDRTELLL